MKLLLQSRMFLKMMISFMLVLATVTIALSVTLYLGFEQSALRNVMKTNAKFLSHISYSFDYINETAKNFTWSTYGEADTVPLMYQDNTDYIQLIESMDRINRFVQMNSFVHSVYIYNSKLQRFLASGNQPITDAAFFYDQEAVNMVTHFDSQHPERLIAIPRVIENDTLVFTYIMYETANRTNGLDGAVIVNIKGEYLRNIMSSLKAKDGTSTGDTFVMDKNGLLIGASQGGTLDSDIMQMYGDKVAAKDQSSGYFLETAGDQIVMVTYVTTGDLGWNFIHAEPYDAAITDIKAIRDRTILVASCLLGLSLIASILLSLSLYAPIRNLVSQMMPLMQRLPGKEITTDEIAFLDHTFKEAYVVMKDTMTSRKVAILKGLLISSDNSTDLMPTMFEKYKISLDVKQGYVVTIFQIDHYGAFAKRFLAKDQLLLRYAISNLSNELFSNSFNCEVIDMGNDMVVVLINVIEEEQDEILRKIDGLALQVQQWCEENLKLSITATIGSPEQDWTVIPQQFQDTMLLSKYRLVAGHQALLTRALTNNLMTGPYKVSSQEDGLLHEALVNGKLDEVIQLYDKILEDLKCRPYDVIMSNMNYMTYSVYDTLYLMESNGVDRFEVDYNSFIQNVYKQETLEEIHPLFYELFQHITNVVIAKRTKRSSVLADKMIELIQQNYADPNLSRESIATTMNMSKVYLGKVFRDSCGQSIADYIWDIRLEKVVELIRNGDMPLVEILDQCGIENRKYFYKLFKDKYGVTFSEYKLKIINSEA
ncbi:AraC family transcriptional regulator [Paenibacillus nasutitermitis]|uniref:HTH araC/xylS-type domain-containing protein n=1 Tax=Paenibacillus nasutitermitis TaxID=1652958 RepID=A0A917E4D4_9BACL|nr:AraC family transcriptional regulator [Paenibacillus nasutitermitis]GGE02509.1 hypothetical protein GCM10010911_71920 [Paenibacillus nasutitermitis]